MGIYKTFSFRNVSYAAAVATVLGTTIGAYQFSTPATAHRIVSEVDPIVDEIENLQDFIGRWRMVRQNPVYKFIKTGLKLHLNFQVFFTD